MNEKHHYSIIRSNLFNLMITGSYLLFLLFITLSPFDFNPGIDALRHQIMYFLGTVIGYFGVIIKTRSDVLANIVVFIPFGFWVAWTSFSMEKQISSIPLSRRLALWVWPFGVSVFIEFSQLFLPSRHPSLVDISTNTLGGVLGIYVFHILLVYFESVVAKVDTMVKSNWEVRLFILFSFLIIGYAWFPFTFNVSLWSAIQEYQYTLHRSTTLLDLPGAVPYFLLFGYWGLIAVEGVRKHFSFSSSFVYYVVCGTVLTGFIAFVSTGSLFIPDRFWGKEDLVAAVLGAVFGWIINYYLHPRNLFIVSDRSPELARLLRITLGIEIVFLIFASVFPLSQNLSGAVLLQKFRWFFIPFSNYARGDLIVMVLDFLKDLVKFIPLTFTLSAIVFLENKLWKTVSYFPFVILIFILELLQIFNAQIHPDGVDIILGMLSLILGRQLWLILVKVLQLTGESSK